MCVLTFYFLLKDCDFAFLLDHTNYTFITAALTSLERHTCDKNKNVKITRYMLQ